MHIRTPVSREPDRYYTSLQVGIDGSGCDHRVSEAP
jgi:hypothetical protein